VSVEEKKEKKKKKKKRETLCRRLGPATTERPSFLPPPFPRLMYDVISYLSLRDHSVVPGLVG
jgi:hypothetical protein